MVQSELTRLVTLLSREHGKSRNLFLCEQGEAVHVGRNNVWQISLKNAPKELFFAKFFFGEVRFKREYEGLKIAQELATKHDWIMAPEIIHVDSQQNMLVTRALKGVTLQSILQDAYRYPILRSNRSFTQFLQPCIARLVSWLHLFQNVLPKNTKGLVDYTIATVSNSISMHLNRELGFCPLTPAMLDKITESSHDKIKLVHGDFSPTNIYINGDKIGVIDFEDLGFGPIYTDTFTLFFFLDQMNKNFFRNKKDYVAPLEKILPDKQKTILYTLKHTIHQLIVIRQMKELGKNQSLFRQAKSTVSLYTEKRRMLSICQELANLHST